MCLERKYSLQIGSDTKCSKVTVEQKVWNKKAEQKLKGGPDRCKCKKVL